MSALLSASGLALAGRLEPCALEASGGELVCVIGPNGSGKTSLLHAIAGIGQPQGIVRIDGIDPGARVREARLRLLSYLPASRDIRWPLTGLDVIRLGLPADQSSPDEGLIAALDLATLLPRRVDRLSTGERSRVLIARALAARPRLLLLDEPVANLDPLWQLRLLDHLAVNADGATLVAIHDLDLARRYATRIVVMDEGRIAADDTPDAILGGDVIPRVFGVAHRDGIWQPV